MKYPSDLISEPRASLLVICVHGLCFCVCEVYCVFCEVFGSCVYNYSSVQRGQSFDGFEHRNIVIKINHWKSTPSPVLLITASTSFILSSELAVIAPGVSYSFCQSFVNHYLLLVSLLSGNETTSGGANNSLCVSGLRNDVTMRTFFRCKTPLYGRHLFIRLLGSYRVLTLCEVEVFSAVISSKEVNILYRTT